MERLGWEEVSLGVQVAAFPDCVGEPAHQGKKDTDNTAGAPGIYIPILA